jgi:hypothetical protein
MWSELSSFLKTGVYNNLPLFSPPRRSVVVIGALAAISFTVAIASRPAPLPRMIAYLRAAILVLAAVVGTLYFLIYADLALAKISSRAGFGVAIIAAIGAEIILLAIAFYVYRAPLDARLGRSPSPTYPLFSITLSSVGLSKSVLLLLAPKFPIWGLSIVTCNGPCL